MFATDLMGVLHGVYTRPVSIIIFSSYMPISPTPWVLLALAGVLMVMGVASMIYALSGLWGGAQARAWSRKQMIECVLSIVLLIMFSFLYAFFLFNPTGYLSGLHLVPSACSSGTSPATNLFALSSCDISTFQQSAFTYVGWDMLYAISATALTPGIRIQAEITSTVNFIWTLPSIWPFSLTTATALVTSVLIFVLMLNQIQVILISAAPLFLSLFLTLGIVARTFGITRTFGGTMIAFGLGLGFIYPLLIAVTYGFLTVQIAAYYPYSIFGILGSTLCVSSSTASCIPPALGSMITSILTLNPATIGTADTPREQHINT